MASKKKQETAEFQATPEEIREAEEIAATWNAVKRFLSGDESAEEELKELGFQTPQEIYDWATRISD